MNNCPADVRAQERLDRFVIATLLDEIFKYLRHQWGQALVADICSLKAGWWLESSTRDLKRLRSIEISHRICDYICIDLSQSTLGRAYCYSLDAKEACHVLLIQMLHHIRWYGTRVYPEFETSYPVTKHTAGIDIRQYSQRLAALRAERADIGSELKFRAQPSTSIFPSLIKYIPYQSY